MVASRTKFFSHFHHYHHHIAFPHMCYLTEYIVLIKAEHFQPAELQCSYFLSAEWVNESAFHAYEIFCSIQRFSEWNGKKQQKISGLFNNA